MNKLEWSRVISSEAEVKTFSLLDSQGVALAIEAACLARQKGMQATRTAQKAKQWLRLAAERQVDGESTPRRGRGYSMAEKFKNFQP